MAEPENFVQDVVDRVAQAIELACDRNDGSDIRTERALAAIAAMPEFPEQKINGVTVRDLLNTRRNLTVENSELVKALAYERKRADRLQADLELMEKAHRSLVRHSLGSEITVLDRNGPTASGNYPTNIDEPLK